MKRTFWIHTGSFWKTIGLNIGYIALTIWELFKLLFMVAVTAAIGFALVFGIIKIGKYVIKDIEEESTAREQRRIEEAESLKMHYAGREFYKFNMDGHAYWYVDGGSMRGGGLCHSETCPCHTNKVEVVQ